MSETGEEASERAHAMCLFLPLPLPLPIVHGTVIPFGDGEFKHAEHLHGLRASVKIHQTTMSGSAEAALSSRLLDFAHKMTTGAPKPTDTPRPFEEEIQFTIAEVVVPVGKNPSEDESPLEVAVEAVRRVQRATMLKAHSAVPLLSRQTLPFMVPMFSQRLEADGQVSWGGPSLLLAVDTGATERLAPSAPATLDAAAIQHALEQSMWGGPLMVAAEMGAEAYVQLHHLGDYRSSVMTLAAACEVLLDALLMSMLWEEGKDPSAAVHYFGTRMGHTQRVLSEYAPRLGGAWRKDRGAVARYLHELVQLRQRIMHAGDQPTEREAETAHAAAVGLEEHMNLRLRAPAIQKRYPRTAVLYCSSSQLDEDGALTGVARALLKSSDEGLWYAQHERWADWASRFLDPDPPLPGASPDDLLTLVEFDLDSSLVIVFDEHARAAAVPNEPAAWLPPDSGPARQVHDLIRHERPHMKDGEWHRARVGDVRADPDLVRELTWQRDNELMRENDHRLPSPRAHGPQLLPHQLRALM